MKEIKSILIGATAGAAIGAAIDLFFLFKDNILAPWWFPFGFLPLIGGYMTWQSSIAKPFRFCRYYNTSARVELCFRNYRYTELVSQFIFGDVQPKEQG